MCFPQEIVQNIYAERQNPDLKRYDCFIMVILSHGNRGVIYGMDTERVSTQSRDNVLTVRNASS